MKTIFTTTLMLALLLTISSCKKDRTINQPPQNKLKFAINVANLPTSTPANSNLTAIVSVKSSIGELVITDAKVNLNYSNGFLTDVLELPKGNYRITKLIIQDSNSNALFASPLAGSAKAQTVVQPLEMPLALENELTKILTIEVTAISDSDRSEDFGYAAGSFRLPPPDQNSDLFKVEIRPLFRVGEVVYDSIPASLRITTYGLNGTQAISTQVLPAGGKTITLSKNVSKYKIMVSKWGLSDEMEIPANEMKDMSLSIGGANLKPKKLKSESVYRYINGQWVADTRKEYEYFATGKLFRINYLSKDVNGNKVLDASEEFEYQNNRVSEIYFTSTSGDRTQYFSYLADGKIDKMREVNNEGTINATVSYAAIPGKRGITGNYQIGATYSFSYKYYQQHVFMDMYGGNAENYSNTTTHGNAKLSLISYDFNINPHAHLGVPNFWLNNVSKHNKLSDISNYSIIIPNVEAYAFSYTYDVDGFPTELFTKYRNPVTFADTHVTKTVFVYQ
ncbi:hypothetical protein ACQKCH_05675 [Nubsella zeaxanthinifaciens]|uniref:hypothetical protein n=1 Tax=Nubsella zeaxanthinifaciens TaxID=392412 RepID=UPI003CFE9C93